MNIEGVSEHIISATDPRKDPLYIIREGAHFSAGHPNKMDPLSQYRRAMSNRANGLKDGSAFTNQDVEQYNFAYQA